MTNLSSSVNWARYWGLKALQQLLKCTELQAQTCTVKIDVGNIIRNSRDVKMRGYCRKKPFNITCTLERTLGLLETTEWKLTRVEVHLEDEAGPFIFVGNELEGYPQQEVLPYLTSSEVVP